MFFVFQDTFPNFEASPKTEPPYGHFVTNFEIWAIWRARVPRHDPNFSPNRPYFRLGDPVIEKFASNEALFPHPLTAEKKSE